MNELIAQSRGLLQCGKLIYYFKALSHRPAQGEVQKIKHNLLALRISLNG